VNIVNVHYTWAPTAAGCILAQLAC